MSRAVLLYRGRTGWARQYAACLRYLDRTGYLIVSVTTDGASALALVRDGQAAAVVVAIEGPGDDELSAAVEAAGGVFAYTRAPSQRRNPEPAAEFVLRMRELGTSADAIAHLLGLSLDRVRTILDGQPTRAVPTVAAPGRSGRPG